MPSLHHQYHGDAVHADGSKVPIPPVKALAMYGPWVDVTISLSDQVAASLLEAERKTISGRALIDSGASTSCIDDGIVERLNLSPIDRVKMASASHAGHDANVYPVKILINNMATGINIPRAIGAQLSNQDIVALLGRDMLAFCTMFYNGPAGELTISV